MTPMKTLSKKINKPGAKLGHVRLFLVNLSDYYLAPKSMSFGQVRKYIEKKETDIIDFQLVSLIDKPERNSPTFGEQIQQMDFEEIQKPKLVYFD